MMTDQTNHPTSRQPRLALLSFLGFLVTLLFAVEAPAQTSEPETSGYKISPEDLLEVSVWKEEDLQREVVVRPDGGISFPLVGDIQAAGKTTAELEAEVTEGIQTYVPDAVVTVSVLEVRGMRIYVSGKVRNPGQFVVGRYIDVLQAITLAGGLTPFADQKDIHVIRRTEDGEKVFDFNYNDVQRGRSLNQNIQLQSDDIVVVP